MGGIVGRNNGGTIIDCQNAATISGFVNVGGISGIGGNVSGSVNTGNVTGTSRYVGGIAGNNDGTVQNCQNSGNVNASGSTATEVGGVVGLSGAGTEVVGTVTGCGNTGKVFGGTNTGGVVGLVFNAVSKVEKSCNAGAVSGKTFTGGVAGYSVGSITNCYAWGDVTGTANTGGVVGNLTGSVMSAYHARGAINGGTGSSGGIVGGGSGAVMFSYALADSITGNPKYTITGGGNTTLVCLHTSGLSGATVNSGSTLKAKPADISGWPEGGDFTNAGIWRWESIYGLPVLTGTSQVGAKEQPYIISTRADLDTLAGLVNGGNTFAGKYFKVVNDIEMTTTNFTPIGNYNNPFGGTFDGGGRTINNLATPDGNGYRALFGHIGTGGTARNIMMTNVNIVGWSYLGGVAGRNSGTVENCFVSGRIYCGYAGGSSGGVVGTNQAGGVVRNVILACNEVAAEYCGGIVDSSVSGSTVENCVAYSGAIRGLITNGRQGKLIGSSSASVTNCYSTEKVTLTGISTTTGPAGTNVASSAMTAAWWRNTAGFDMDNVWQWVDINNPPKLRVQ